MVKNSLREKGFSVPRRLWWVLGVLIALAIVAIVAAHQVYNSGLKPVSNSQKTQIFTVETGSTVKQISTKLEKNHLIRSAWAFQLYVHSKDLSDRLQAGTYAFAPSYGTARIVSTLTQGKVDVRLVTILPGRRIDQVRADLINSGFLPDAVNKALDPGQYSDLPALAYKPAKVHTLEGLLWPDSFQKDANTSPSHIIRESLVAMGNHLTPDVQAAFAAHGLTTYKGLILSSIVLQEVDKPADQSRVAQVFLARLKRGSTLDSDATAKYGAIASGREPDLNFDSVYNTYNHKGLPPTPISTITASSLKAAAHPANTKWLYFVAGDNGVTYFSSNLDDHEANVHKYCHKLCGN